MPRAKKYNNRPAKVRRPVYDDYYGARTAKKASSTSRSAGRFAPLGRYNKSGQYIPSKGFGSRYGLGGVPLRRPLKGRARRITGNKAMPASVQRAVAMNTAAQTCSWKWLRQLLNPFEGPNDACNPYTPPIYSERMRAWLRQGIGSNNFNAAGNAIVLMRFQPTSDIEMCRLSTTAAYVSGSTAFTTATPTLLTNNSAFTSSQFTDTQSGMQWAPVTRWGVPMRPGVLARNIAHNRRVAPHVIPFLWISGVNAFDGSNNADGSKRIVDWVQGTTEGNYLTHELERIFAQSNQVLVGMGTETTS